MLRILRRRGWVLVAAVLVTTLFADLVASHRGVTYSAESTAVVSASPNSLLTPDQSNTLAGTYAVLIPKDTAILGSVASRLGTSVSDVQKRISVINTIGTALLQIDYRGTSAANSIAGATAALSGDHRLLSGLAEHHSRIRRSRPGADQGDGVEKRGRPRGDRRDPWHRTGGAADGRVGAG